jgi:hypothetical protein
LAGGVEAGDRRGVVCARLIGFGGCPAYDVNANQVFGWRKLYRDGAPPVAEPTSPLLVPVTVPAEPSGEASPAPSVVDTIEIVLVCGYRVRVSSGFDAHALLIATAKLNDIDPEAWLADVLGRINEQPVSRLHELLPWHWRKSDVTAAAA